MKVKGIGIKTTREFVKARFGSKYDAWVNALPESSKPFYKTIVNVSEWFPIKEAYITPIDKIVEFFYNNDYKKGGEEIGAFSAELALKGIYKVFLLVTTPNFLMVRGSKIMSTYYDPCEIHVSEKGFKTVSLRFTDFAEMTPAMEYRAAGWCKRALELCNCKNVKCQITFHLTKKDPYTELVLNWD